MTDVAIDLSKTERLILESLVRGYIEELLLEQVVGADTEGELKEVADRTRRFTQLRRIIADTGG